jgi:DNA-binding transcriptional ArsR family regulator
MDSGGLGYEAQDTLVVSDPAQLRALGDAVRGRIVSLLRERACSVTQLAEELEMPKSTVAHHVKVLEAAGLIQVVRTREVRAVTEKFYGRVARLFLIEHEGEDPKLLQDIAAATLQTAASELGAAGGSLASHALVRARIAETDAQRFERRLKKLVDDFRKAENGSGATFGLAVALYRREQRDA